MIKEVGLDAGASYDAFVGLFESIEHSLSGLDIYIKFTPMSSTAAMEETIINIMLELFSTITSVTGSVIVQIKEKRLRESVRHRC